MKRRQFIHQASCAAVGSTTLFSTLLSLKAAGAASMANSAVINAADYKALVCILLAGGNDSFNMLMPREGTPYQEYMTTRSNLAINSSNMLPITPLTNNGPSLGLHPSLTNLKQMFDQGKAAFLTNVGTLVEPTTTDQFHLESVQLPLGLLSHSDQIAHWQTAFPQDRKAVGWGGKIADLISDMNNNQTLSMNVSLSGSNIFQTGNNSIEYAIDPVRGPEGIIGYGGTEGHNLIRTKAIDDMVEKSYADIFEKTYVETIKNSRDAFVQYSSALDQIAPLDVPFGEDNWRVAQSLNMIARTIAARDILDLQRQTFFIQFGGWDHHDEVLMSQTSMFSALDSALASFQDSLDQLGLADSVTTFIISDFGRTLGSNGNGTDHAWGGNVFALRGDVNGGDVYGRYPSISLSDPSDLGGGIFVPELSADEYFAELAMWFGVPAQDLPLILPNIGNFYDINSGQSPIGFIN